MQQLFEDFLRLSGAGLILEFGVYRGRSLNEIARAVAPLVVYGFDSFEGLPEAWVGAGAPAGHFKCEVPEVEANVELVVGLFQDTLGPFLERHFGPVSFCHIDSDIYSSAVYVLGALRERFVAGSVIAFDEIAGAGNWEEERAWEEYRRGNGQVWECVGSHHREGQIWRLTK